MKNDLNIKSLLEGIRKRDQKAFEDLVAAYGKKMRNLAFSLTGDRAAAEDICQEAFITVWNKIANLREPGAFENWLYRIILNRSREYFRKIGRTRSLAEGLRLRKGKIPADGFEKMTENENLARRIERAVENLSFFQKEVFLLKHQDGLKITEIAGILKRREGTVKTHLYRAVKNLRKELDNIQM